MRAIGLTCAVALLAAIVVRVACAQEGSGPADAGADASTSAPPGAPAPASAETLRVGFAGSEPFVFHDSQVPRGLSIEVWRRVATELGVQTTWRSFDDIGGLLDAVDAGEIDVGVGPISVTAERARKLDFTQPYFSARVGILSSPESSLWESVRPFFTRAFLVGLLTLCTVLLLVGTLIWLVERKRNPEQFPEAPLAGIGNGMWFALVTMTTVGYGDRAPATAKGRAIASVWMLIAMVAASSITAGIASALTLSQIDSGGISSLDHLKDRRVAVVRGSPAEWLARRRSARCVVVDSKTAGFATLESGRAEAMLYEQPILDHYLEQHPERPWVVSATPVRADDYAFAMAVDSGLRRPIDAVLLRMRESRVIADLASEWTPDE